MLPLADVVRDHSEELFPSPSGIHFEQFIDFPQPLDAPVTQIVSCGPRRGVCFLPVFLEQLPYVRDSFADLLDGIFHSSIKRQKVAGIAPILVKLATYA